MAFRIKSDGTIETDSADEAMEMFRRLAEEREAAANLGNDEGDHGEDRDEPDRAPSAREITLGTHAKAMLKLLMDTQPKHGRATGAIATSLGVSGPKGLAAVTRQIRAWGSQTFDLDGDECVERFISQAGNSALKIGEALRAKIKGRETELLG